MPNLIVMLTIASHLVEQNRSDEDWFLGVLLIAIMVVLVYFYFFTKKGKAWMARSRKLKEERRPKSLSQVGVKNEGTAGGLARPKCGGTQFKVQRKMSTKLAFGVASMLGQAK